MKTLEVENLCRKFGGLDAVNNLSFSVETGKISGLVGPNGAGKTTVLNLISGMDTPSSGVIRINGIDTGNLKTHQYANLGLSRTYQNIKLFKGMSVVEHVLVGLDTRRNTKLWQMLVPTRVDLRERSAMHEKAMELLERLSISHLAEVDAMTLSYGLQRRLEIARALGSQPKLLLLDEPTAGMNKSESADIKELLESLNKEGLTILIVEHNIKFISDICSEVTVINFGEKLRSGSAEEVFNSKDVRDAYLGKERNEMVLHFEKLRAGVSRDLDVASFSRKSD